MAERSELESRVRRLVAADITYRVFKSLGDKGIRRLNKSAEEIVQLLESEEPGYRFLSKIEESEEKKARTLRQGIDIFREKHTRSGVILERIIAETRAKKNRHLVYGLNEGYKLSEEDYVQIMIDLGFDRREASGLYPHITAISERLDKANETAERKILLS